MDVLKRWKMTCLMNMKGMNNMVEYQPGSGVMTITVPKTLIPAINKYNVEYRGPKGNAINITQTCIDALQNELDKRGVK